MNSEQKSSWENRISSAMAFGHFVYWRDASAFSEDLSEILSDLDVFAKDRPMEALGGMEIFIAACLVKGGEVDDSGGSFGMFLNEVFLAWTRFCDAAEVTGDEFV